VPKTPSYSRYQHKVGRKSSPKNDGDWCDLRTAGESFLRNSPEPSMAAHTCNPSYIGGEIRKERNPPEVHPRRASVGKS
jgi:hypothetical protein